MKIKIGTRRSALAMAQTNMVISALKEAFPNVESEIVPFTTAGDKNLRDPLAKIGGKGVFVGEIEAALQSGEIDLAVHSAKDLPVSLAEGLDITAVLPRGDCRDILITPKGCKFSADDVFTVGTGSLRRRINLSDHFPNAEFAEIRGNIDTRLKKLLDGQYDAIILCAAGIERLGPDMSQFSAVPFSPESFLPAPCQGIIAVESGANSPAAELCRGITHAPTEICFRAERAVIKLLGADCTTPLGAYSELHGENIFAAVRMGKNKKVSGERPVGEMSLLIKELTDRI